MHKLQPMHNFKVIYRRAYLFFFISDFFIISRFDITYFQDTLDKQPFEGPFNKIFS